MIQEWINNGCDYQGGIDLYSQFPHNKNLLKLFKRKESTYNKNKLYAELLKNLKVEVKKTISIDSDNVSDEEIPKSTLQINPISFYPPELHDVYKKRVQSFYDACSLKVLLNSILEDDSETALKIQFQIFDCWEINNKCFEILEHYEKTKRILPSEIQDDFSQLNPQELVNERQKLYANVSKRKKTILGLEEKLPFLEKGRSKVLLQNKINNKKEELHILNLKIEKLTNIIKK